MDGLGGFAAACGGVANTAVLCLPRRVVVWVGWSSMLGFSKQVYLI